MKPTVFAKLSVMMLLEYFIWSSWYVTMSTYMGVNLGSSGVQIGAARRRYRTRHFPWPR